MAKNEALKIRDYQLNPIGSHEAPYMHERSGLVFTDEDYKNSPTKQSEAAACDINLLMERYAELGVEPAARPGLYGDFSTMETFHEAQNIVARANSQFFALPGEVRAKFQNDPGRFLESIERAESDPKWAGELVELGVLEPRVIEKDTPVEILKEIRENTKPKASKAPAKNESGDD